MTANDKNNKIRYFDFIRILDPQKRTTARTHAVFADG